MRSILHSAFCMLHCFAGVCADGQRRGGCTVSGVPMPGLPAVGAVPGTEQHPEESSGGVFQRVPAAPAGGGPTEYDAGGPAVVGNALAGGADAGLADTLPGLSAGAAGGSGGGPGPTVSGVCGAQPADLAGPGGAGDRAAPGGADGGARLRLTNARQRPLVRVPSTGGAPHAPARGPPGMAHSPRSGARLTAYPRRQHPQPPHAGRATLLARCAITVDGPRPPP